MQRGEARVGDGLRADFCGWSWNELDDTWWYACLFENLEDDVVRVGRRGRGFPDGNVADECRS